MAQADTMLAKHLKGKRILESNYDIGLLLMSYLGLHQAQKVEKEIMQMRKEFTISGYRFSIGLIDPGQFTVGFLSWPTIKGVTQDELRKYRYAMFQAQNEMKKMHDDVERLLQKSLIG